MAIMGWLNFLCALVLYSSPFLLNPCYAGCSGKVHCDRSLPDCGPTDFHCISGGCINITLKCDGKFDCYDGSDEEDCCILTSHSFPCRSGECIDLSKRCDGSKDCPNGDDEGEFCHESSCSTFGCSHHCVSTEDGPKCYCYEGFELDFDRKRCVDINECLFLPTKRPCLQECINSVGGFRCSCFSDYHLASDTRCAPNLENKVRCQLFPKDSFLLVSSKQQIKKYNFDCMEKVATTFSLNFLIGSFTYNWRDRIIFGYDHFKRRILSLNLNNKEQKSIVKFAKIKLPLEGLKYDSYTGNLFWLLPGEGFLQSYSLRSKKFVNLTTGLEDGHEIEVNPLRDEIYISIWGLEPKILVANLDGSNMRPIEEVGPLGRPASISVQVRETESRIYWIDSVHGALGFVDISGLKGTFGPKTIIRRDLHSVHSMVIHRDMIFLAYHDGSIFEVPVYQSLKRPKLLSSNTMTKVSDIHLVYAYNDNHSSPCLSPEFNCSHICLMLDKQPICQCPRGFTLGKDQRTCVKLECSSDELMCDNGKMCYKKKFKCDENFDCDDGSDEQNCETKRCEDGHRFCSEENSGPCIPDRWFCDGFKDCLDGFDEQDCTANCTDNEFNCGTSCISKKWVCDSISDCLDGKDEKDC